MQWQGPPIKLYWTEWTAEISTASCQWCDDTQQIAFYLAYVCTKKHFKVSCIALLIFSGGANSFTHIQYLSLSFT